MNDNQAIPKPLPASRLCNSYNKPNPIFGDGALGNQYQGRMYYKGENKQELVKILQNMLVALGYDIGPEGVDGKFGDETEKAVKQFQEKNRDWKGDPLIVDGLVGPETADALNRAMVGKWYDEYGTPGELTKDTLHITVSKDKSSKEISFTPEDIKKVKITVANKTPAVPPTRIHVGINYPWGHDSSGRGSYGWDFGPAPYDGIALWKNGRIEDDLKAFKSLGIFAVRWYILGDGTNYGTGSEGVPPSLPTGFVKDFGDLLAIFDKNQMKLIPSLIDFKFCYEAERKYDNERNLIAIKGGRSHFLTLPQRKDFLDKVLDKLLDASKEHMDAIYAWEIMNEPEPCVIDSKEGDAKYCVPIAEDEMVAFIEEGIDRINKKGFQSTVGYRNFETMNSWKGIKPYLGVTLRQFHFYPRGSKSLPNYDGMSPPCFIGEFAANTTRVIIDGKDKNEPWSELGNNDTVYMRLNRIEQKGYPCAFLWSAKSKPTKPDDDPHTDWPQQKQSPPAQGTPQYDIWKYTSGR